MNMSGAIVSVLAKYSTFSGRASRSEYWWYTLAFSVLAVAVICLDLIAMDRGYRISASLGLLGFVLPNLALSVRRLHDIGKSGWYVLWTYQPMIVTLLLVLGPSLLGVYVDPSSYTPLWILTLPVGPIMIFVWACKKGDDFENEYGPNPLDEYEQIYSY